MFNSEKYISKIERFALTNTEDKELVHIALAFDDNYAMPAGVTILSVIQNTPNFNLHFHLFVDNVSHINLDKFKKFNYSNVSITLYYLNNNFSINPKTLVLHIPTVSTCIRFIMPNLLVSVTDKLIYLDSDIICLQSLAKLAEFDIDNYIAGVVSDTKDMQQAISKMYNIDSTKYFNAGVLLINTKKWCEENISEKALTLINDGNIYKFADQDVLNILLENKTLLLPIKFNTKIKISIDAHQEKEIRPYTVILHYISQNKPWFKVYLSKIFEYYFSLSPWKDEQLPLSGDSSSIRNYAKYLFKQKAYYKSIYYYIIYLKYKLFLKK